MSSVNKVILVEAYESGMSIPQVAEAFGVARSTVRHHVAAAGALRSRVAGVRKAATEGRLGSGFRGKSRVLTEEHKKNISKARKEWADAGNALGITLKPSGYLAYTRGKHKDRSVHIIEMEERLGRRLKSDECVHHINGDKLNNHHDNLALLTVSGHGRLHRLQDQISGNERERDEYGRFC